MKALKEYKKPLTRAVFIEHFVPLCQSPIPPDEPVIDPDEIEDNYDVEAD